jgi:1-acyl-sn-glycerol-3-phosphate acyltransferase
LSAQRDFVEEENVTTTGAISKNYRKASLSFIILRFLARILLKGLFKIEVRGLEKLPSEESYIFAGNHLSWIDPFLMLVCAPAEPRIYFIAAREEVEKPEWRKFFTKRIGGVIPVDRGQGNAYRQTAVKVKEVLNGGGVLGIFPEGDVSAIETGRILPLKKGIGYFAAQSGAAIVPVAFSGTKELWLRKHIIMIVGEPIPGRQGGRAIAEELTQKTAEGIRAVLPPPMPVNPNSPKLLKNFFTKLFTQEEKEHPIPE